MKKKLKIAMFPLLILGVFIVVTGSCDKDDNNSDNPLNGKTTAVFNPNITYGTMTDQDGNIYKTVTIGTQIWMAENLRTTKYNDGTAIPNITDEEEWGSLTTGAYCNYDNTSNPDTIATLGRLYNWYAVNTGKLAPSGWHVPTDAEWTELTDYLGGESIAGGKLKETGTVHWLSPNTGATNETGFTAIPGEGRNNIDGKFGDLGHYLYCWSVTEFNIIGAEFRGLTNNENYVFGEPYDKKVGISVRCVRD